jgi:hypothetical protein
VQTWVGASAFSANSIAPRQTPGKNGGQTFFDNCRTSFLIVILYALGLGTKIAAWLAFAFGQAFFNPVGFSRPWWATYCKNHLFFRSIWPGCGHQSSDKMIIITIALIRSFVNFCDNHY